MNRVSVEEASRFESLLIAFILFNAGIRFTLPVPFNEDIVVLRPWRAQPISSFGNFFSVNVTRYEEIGPYAE